MAQERRSSVPGAARCCLGVVFVFGAPFASCWLATRLGAGADTSENAMRPGIVAVVSGSWVVSSVGRDTGP